MRSIRSAIGEWRLTPWAAGYLAARRTPAADALAED
jgi:hypothetical protein